MRWFVDRTGFPLVELPDLGFAVHLLPIAKHQFERFLAEPGPFGDVWYEEMLTISPRIALSNRDPETLEDYFLSGIQPSEIAPFSRWFGQEYDLPSAEQWRSIDRIFSAQSFDIEMEAMLQGSEPCEPARVVLTAVMRQRKPQTLDQLALLRGGLLEWVKLEKSAFGGLGSPRPKFYSLIANPHRDAPIKVIDPTKRHRYFGFRLIRSMNSTSETTGR